MAPEEFYKFTRKLVAQGEAYTKGLIELAVYSNGSLTYEQILMMPISQIRQFETAITNKIKADKGIKDQAML